MIAKQSIGKSFMGALNYNLKKMYSPDKTVRAELLETNFISLQQPNIRKELAMMNALNPGLRRNTYHASLNFSLDDNLSNRTMLAVATDYMRRMGFDNNAYFIFRHHDTAHPHCHILALRNRFDGTVVSDSNNYRRSEQIIRELEKKYSLARVKDSTLSQIKAPNKDELEMVQRTGKGSKKMIMQEKVLQSIAQSGNMKEFILNLQREGIHVLFNQASTGRVSGITYFMAGFKAKGQALGNQFKWHALIKNLDYEQIRDGKEISQANNQTRAKYEIGQTGTVIAESGAGWGAFGIHESTRPNIQKPAHFDEGDKRKSTTRLFYEGHERVTENNHGGKNVTETDKNRSTDPVFHPSDPFSGLGHLFGGMDVGDPIDENERKRKRRKGRGR